MSQNRNVTDRRRVFAALQAQGEAAVAAIIAETPPQ